jgi:hypothetical protein
MSEAKQAHRLPCRPVKRRDECLIAQLLAAPEFVRTVALRLKLQVAAQAHAHPAPSSPSTFFFNCSSRNRALTKPISAVNRKKAASRLCSVARGSRLCAAASATARFATPAVAARVARDALRGCASACACCWGLTRVFFRFPGWLPTNSALVGSRCACGRPIGSVFGAHSVTRRRGIRTADARRKTAGRAEGSAFGEVSVSGCWSGSWARPARTKNAALRLARRESRQSMHSRSPFASFLTAIRRCGSFDALPASAPTALRYSSRLRSQSTQNTTSARFDIQAQCTLFVTHLLVKECVHHAAISSTFIRRALACAGSSRSRSYPSMLAPRYPG